MESWCSLNIAYIALYSGGFWVQKVMNYIKWVYVQMKLNTMRCQWKTACYCLVPSPLLWPFQASIAIASPFFTRTLCTLHGMILKDHFLYNSLAGLALVVYWKGLYFSFQCPKNSLVLEELLESRVLFTLKENHHK